MPSIWKRITASHVSFVTTGYVRLVEPVAMAFVRVGVTANTLTTLGTVSTILGGVAFGTGHIRIGGIIVALTAVADSRLDLFVAFAGLVQALAPQAVYAQLGGPRQHQAAAACVAIEALQRQALHHALAAAGADRQRR